MLLDTDEGMHELHSRFSAFLASQADEAAFPAETRGNPSPYTEFLGGLRVRKADANLELRLGEDRWLELSGPLEDLRQFAEKILVTEQQGHRHYYSAPVSLILEADNHWPTELSRP